MYVYRLYQNAVINFSTSSHLRHSEEYKTAGFEPSLLVASLSPSVLFCTFLFCVFCVFVFVFVCVLSAAARYRTASFVQDPRSSRAAISTNAM